MTTFSTKRLREIDFLRGVAILLVLFSHQHFFIPAKNAGWIGVDLFFVLSGFLVSGLLFKEYKKFGNIKPVNFLIRRGFKIYPLYYIFYIPYLIRILLENKLKPVGLLADLIFTQNYIWGLGFAYGPSWSLAVEEHFYFCITIVLFFMSRRVKERNILEPENPTQLGKFEKGCLILMLLCLVARFYSNIFHPELSIRTYTMTHLRADSLLAGIFIMYLYQFKPEFLKSSFDSHKKLLGWLAVIFLLWTPLDAPLTESTYWFFARTIGFTLLTTAFSILLCWVILTPEINLKLNRIFSRRLVDVISYIGRCSYAIYIIHSFTNQAIEDLNKYFGLPLNAFLIMCLQFTISICTGILLTATAEKWFLKIRDHYVASRAEIVDSQPASAAPATVKYQQEAR